MITVIAAPPFATIQDLGRTGFRDIGVPVSGIADRESGIALNTLVGNDPTDAMIEWAVAGGVLGFERNTTIAFGGAEASCRINGALVNAWTRLDISAGDELRVERIIRGRFLLFAVRGGIDVPMVMGSRSTLLSAAIGGHEGRRLRTGDRLRIGAHSATTPSANASAPVRLVHERICVMRGPQLALFREELWESFLAAEFTVSRASDRTGYRLDGASVAHDASGALPSEPACVGAVQIPDGGQPIVIMHDGPTVGGYPKIAVIRSSSLSAFAQLAPGDSVRFVLDETSRVHRRAG